MNSNRKTFLEDSDEGIEHKPAKRSNLESLSKQTKETVDSLTEKNFQLEIQLFEANLKIKELTNISLNNKKDTCSRFLFMPSNARISHVLHTEVNYMVNDKSVDTSKIIEKIMVELIPEKDWLRLDINEIRSEFCCAYAACFGFINFHREEEDLINYFLKVIEKLLETKKKQQNI